MTDYTQKIIREISCCRNMKELDGLREGVDLLGRSGEIDFPKVKFAFLNKKDKLILLREKNAVLLREKNWRKKSGGKN